MFENKECTDCELYKGAKHRCLPSQGDKNCTLAIFLDSPAMIEDKRGRSFVSDNADFVKFCLRRMSIDPAAVYLDYIVKCYAKKLPGKADARMACVRACAQYRLPSLSELPRLRAVVALGSLGCETFTQTKTMGKRQGAEWVPASPIVRKLVPHVWIGFSPGLLKEKPSEAGTIFRVIWKAAEEANLNPKVANIKPYEFDI